jgi:hypothetical protein
VYTNVEIVETDEAQTDAVNNTDVPSLSLDSEGLSELSFGDLVVKSGELISAVGEIVSCVDLMCLDKGNVHNPESLIDVQVLSDVGTGYTVCEQVDIIHVDTVRTDDLKTLLSDSEFICSDLLESNASITSHLDWVSGSRLDRQTCRGHRFGDKVVYDDADVVDIHVSNNLLSSGDGNEDASELSCLNLNDCGLNLSKCLRGSVEGQINSAFVWCRQLRFVSFEQSSRLWCCGLLLLWCLLFSVREACVYSRYCQRHRPICRWSKIRAGT